MDWVYVTLSTDGYLIDEEGFRYCEVRFVDEADAEKYLIENDCRASIANAGQIVMFSTSRA